MRDHTGMEVVETGLLPSGHPYTRIGTGSKTVLSIPGLSFTAEAAKPASARRSWKRWLEPIERFDLTFVEVGRRADLPPGSSAADVADDYASVIREQWGRAVGVMGISTGGHYGQWLASHHPDLVERLVLGFTAHRLTDDVRERQDQAVGHFLAGRWRSGWAMFGPWAFPSHPTIGSAAAWLIGPYIGGRPSDLRVLRVDAHADDTHDATAALAGIRCPTLVVSGGRALAYPPQLVPEFVAGIPDARHIEYPDSGHMGPGPVFAEDVCRYLANADPAQRP